MKLIKPKFEILEQRPGISGIYRMIELAGRTCYRSEDKITPDSAVAFVDRMIKSGHGAMLEHGTVYLIIPFEYIDISEKFDIPIVSNIVKKYQNNPYTKWRLRDDGFSQLAFITTNLRVLVENNWMDDLQYVCEPTEYHEKRITVRLTCDRGVSHEFVRHRVFSFAQESTRYCNYIKSKFGGSVTFITPPWLKQEDELEFEEDMQVIENLYFKWLNKGWTAQQARGFLCNFLKTELVMTGTIEQWEGFFKLRDAKDAHPQARELAQPLHEEFIKKG